MTRCRWPTPPADGKQLGILFKASGGGARIRETLRVPPGALLQFQVRGSYRLENVLEYIEWILDRSRTSASSHGPAGASSLPAIMNGDAPLPRSLDIGFQPRDRADGSVDDDGCEPRAAPGRTGRRVLYMLDWFAHHLDPVVDDLIHSAGHAVLRIGGHLTGLVQVEDTHAHASYSAKYKSEETRAALGAAPD